MRARTVWGVGLCLLSTAALSGCARPRATPAPPKPTDNPAALGAACNDPALGWARDRKARWHETIEGARVKLVPEKGNHRVKPEDIETEGRVLALLVVEAGSVEFGRTQVAAGDSVCLFLKGPYPTGTSPGNVRSTFIRKRGGGVLEEVGTRVRLGTPHHDAEVDWIADYDSPDAGGMLPFPPPTAQAGTKIRKQSQTACPGGCCTAKKPV
jgi:hypothetical protein